MLPVKYNNPINLIKAAKIRFTAGRRNNWGFERGENKICIHKLQAGFWKQHWETV
jgi:hypothetical protein